MGIEFNLILKAAGKDTSSGMFWKLLGGTVALLVFGYCGEIRVVNPWFGFCGGLCGWFFILQEIFMGEAGGTAADCSEAVATSFKHAFDRHPWLVHLPAWILVRIFAWSCRRGFPQCHLQRCGLRKQDCFRVVMLVLCQR